METVTIKATYDTWINENVPGNNYSTGDFLRLGDAIDTASRDANILLYFDIASNVPAGAQIEAVRLYMRLYDVDWSGQTSANSQVRKLIREWNDVQATWEIPEIAVSWGTDGALGSTDISATVTYSWTRRSTDTTSVWETHSLGVNGAADVQDWLDNDATNFGWLITGPAPGTASQKNAHLYRSREYGSTYAYAPYIEVDYTPDGVPVVDEDCVVTGDTSPTTATVGATISSDGGDALIHRYVYCSQFPPDYAEAVVLSHDFEAGAVGAISYEFTGLIPGIEATGWVTAVNSVGSASSNVVTWTPPAVTSTSGDGGEGIESAITGTATRYAGGGGGWHTLAANAGVGVDGGGDGGSLTTSPTAGDANTGAGGGGGNTTGGAGGSGLAVISYLTSDAVSATPQLANDIFRPSIAYHSGRLYANYADPDGLVTKSITAASVETGVHTHITCTAHGMETGQVCIISNSSGFDPSLDGVHTATRVDDNTFSIDDVDITDGTGTATLTYNHDVGYAVTGTGYEQGYIRTSRSSFHTGSLMKDFRYISIIHDPLPETGVLQVAYTIDGVRYPTSVMVEDLETEWYDVTAVSTKESRIYIAKQGFEIDMELSLQGNISSILVKGFNVVWNFLKIPKHLYSLDLRAGAGGGRWKENPEDAIKFLISSANVEATFEDRFSGEYQGVIEEVEYTQSNYSIAEGPSGLVKILVREVT